MRLRPELASLARKPKQLPPTTINPHQPAPPHQPTQSQRYKIDQHEHRAHPSSLARIASNARSNAEPPSITECTKPPPNELNSEFSAPSSSLGILALPFSSPFNTNPATGKPTGR